MRIERSKNAARNIVFGVTMKLYQILIPFIMRTIIIYFLGMEYAGLNSLFSSVLQILNLAELGVGSAMIFSMYEPIAKDDKIQICALMRLYRNSSLFGIIGRLPVAKHTVHVAVGISFFFCQCGIVFMAIGKDGLASRGFDGHSVAVS